LAAVVWIGRSLAGFRDVEHLEEQSMAKTDAWGEPEPRDPRSSPHQGTRVVEERRLAAWIGKSLVVQGKVISNQDLTIDGQVEGTIELGQHGLTIGAGAKIKANLVAKTITISGAVTGNVTATEKVDVRSTGIVEGDIKAAHLQMWEGALIRGRVDASGRKTAAANREQHVAPPRQREDQDEPVSVHS
jgi:cytoskeletal protein CcmA (bactofilin family)